VLVSSVSSKNKVLKAKKDDDDNGIKNNSFFSHLKTIMEKDRDLLQDMNKGFPKMFKADFGKIPNF